jgi:hypothetical protein
MPYFSEDALQFRSLAAGSQDLSYSEPGSGLLKSWSFRFAGFPPQFTPEQYRVLEWHSADNPTDFFILIKAGSSLFKQIFRAAI